MNGLEVVLATGAEMDDAYFLGLLAEAHIFAGDPGRALAVVEDALGRITRGRDFFYEAELHRLRGRATIDSSGDTALAKRAFRRALEIARTQKARSPELRAALALASLDIEGSDKQSALDELARVYGQFQDGLETPDLVEARGLLDAYTRTA